MGEPVTEACRRCGSENPPWVAPSPLWNAVMRDGSINGREEWDGIVCATCFTVLAEEKGIASLFRLDSEVVNVELETVTPSGRVWDSEQWRWVEPCSCGLWVCPECRPEQQGEQTSAREARGDVSPHVFDDAAAEAEREGPDSARIPCSSRKRS